MLGVENAELGKAGHCITGGMSNAVLLVFLMPQTGTACLNHYNQNQYDDRCNMINQNTFLRTLFENGL
jgi:hypothetical protein